MVTGPFDATRRVHEQQLVERFQTDPASRSEVVAAFRPLTDSLARRYYRGGEPLEDLQQVALEGLVKALARFNLERGTPFIAYAIPTITGELRRFYRDTGWAAHVPRGVQEVAQKLMVLDRDSDRPLTAEEAAAALDVTLEHVVEGRLAMKAMWADSLDAPGDDDDAAPRLKPGGLDPGYARVEDAATFTARVSTLDERDREIVVLRFVDGLSQREIGERIGISQMQVSRLLQRILGELEADVVDV